MATPGPERTCPCGRSYNFLTRGVTGPFHFRVMTPKRDEDTVVITGHWRSGAYSPGASLYLDRRDGRHVDVQDLLIEPMPDGPAKERGQRRVRVTTASPEAFTDNCGCIVEEGT
jgi:hypothetical protein